MEADNHNATLRLEGSIAGPWVAELRAACKAVMAEGRGLKLDLGDVSFVDADGVALLGGLQSRGVSLIECSPFVEEQLKGTAGKVA